jgi:uncharacterized protein (DUF1697 family)
VDTWVVLLRGINVGGNNVIPMAELRAAFTDMGFVDPQTYIQSGNVVVGSRRTPSAAATRRIEAALAERFGYAARVVVLDAAQMRRTVDEMPLEWRAPRTDVRYYVLFPVAGTSAKDVAGALTAKPAYETITVGSHAVYWSAPFATLSRTSMSKLPSLPVYREVTIRNRNTTLKLLALSEARTVA